VVEFVGCRCQIILLAAGGSLFVGNRRRQAAVDFSRCRWIRLVAGDSTQWMDIGRRQWRIPLVTSGGSGSYWPRVSDDFVGSGWWLALAALAAAGGGWFQRAAVD